MRGATIGKALASLAIRKHATVGRLMNPRHAIVIAAHHTLVSVGLFKVQPHGPLPRRHVRAFPVPARFGPELVSRQRAQSPVEEVG